MTNNESNEHILDPEPLREDSNFDLTLRPGKMSEYIGQDKIKANLEIFIGAAQKRKDALEHVLLYGPPGLGKTTLANVIANEMGVGIKISSGPAIERAGDLASILTNLEEGDILFIDEVHRLGRIVEEVLYPAMEEYKLDIIIGKGPSARSLRLDLPKITIIGATTRISLLSSPLRDRFGAVHQLDFYTDSDIEKIIKRSAKILGIKIDDAGAKEIAKCSRKTPRVANRLLKRVRDYAEVKADGKIDKETAQKALLMLEVDKTGLDKSDRKVLKTIIEKFKGGPVGIATIAAACGEDKDTIEDVYEPYLMQIGFLERTNQGRKVTEAAYKHLKIDAKKGDQPGLF